MKLGELIAGIAWEKDAGRASHADVEITGLTYDSRQVTPGTLFLCIPGEHHDGHDFASEAVRCGAAALLVERPLESGVPEVLVGSVRALMAPIADRFYRHPSHELRVFGITGTNGKTTSAYVIRALIEACGQRCGLLGTVKSVIGGIERPATRTTSEAPDLQRDLRTMLESGDEACAMEVSSHALALGRTGQTRFAAALFTNLTQDHLDFHPTMEDYFKAKRLLFSASASDEPPAVSVLNVDDPYGLRLASELPGAVTFAIEREADYRARIVAIGAEHTQLELSTPAGEWPLKLALAGRFNVYNALGALAAVHATGGDLKTLLGRLEEDVHVPGRLEPVRAGQDFTVLVDYAHTPDALAGVLRSARELLPAGGRVICVFGAGGDRDRSKRPLMGEIAASLSEFVVVTSDNPRSEQPQAIIEEIFSGIHDFTPADHPGGGYTANAVTDRREAIEFAVSEARPGDVLVIAGKGHEQGQEFADGRKLPFDDVTVTREILEGDQAKRSGALA